MSDVEENECEEIECVGNNEAENCMEFQISLMIEQDTQQISILAPKHNKTQNASKKRKLDCNNTEPRSTKSSIFKTSSFEESNFPAINKSDAYSNHNEASDMAKIFDAIDSLQALITRTASKTNQMHEEFQEIKNEQHTLHENSLAIVDRCFIGIPLATKEELTHYEERLQRDAVPRKLLKKYLKRIDIKSWNMYLFQCLKTCFKMKLAAKCSFYGKLNNTETRHLNIIKLITECVAEKFPSVKTVDINHGMTTWFYNQTDSLRKNNQC